MPSMETGVSFTSLDPDSDDRFQWLRRELGLSTFGLSLMRLRPGQRNRIHRHLHQEEAYLVLEGTLTLLIENEPHDLSKGDLARVGPEVRRQLANRGSEPLLVLALGGAHAHESRDGRAYASWDEQGEGRPPQEVPHPEDL
jgi:uncharacterized cupin superfamily protein